MNNFNGLVVGFLIEEILGFIGKELPEVIGVKIGYDKINVGKTSDKIFSSVKTKKKSRKKGKNYQRSNDQFVETNKLDRPWNSARPFAELDHVQFGEGPSWIEHRFSSAVCRAGPVQVGERPSLIDRSPSSPRPHNSSPEITLNSSLFRLNRRYRGNFTI
ncbi:hypothetical protein F2Q70_00011669 [Brassica cretica]|uniref:Uncharacterized protein n=1 Tax=Brassica cretica TaxID=69181 RepID=A0A3N6RNU8_BRACR|nr:hypothetical protein F2Q70_00011669 [Brassica cretica]KAF3546599.1 hypothetical protein DY000_02007071 [Brassica cretica]